MQQRSHTFVIVLGALLFSAACAAAQEVPAADVFAGYSLFHFDNNGWVDALNTAFPGCCATGSKNMHGWEGAAQFNMTRSFGVVADVSGHYGNPIEIPAVPATVHTTFYNVLFGPQFNVRRERVSAYVHTLFGFNRVHVDETPAPASTPAFSNHRFAWAVGGGFDVNGTKHIAIRVAQVDYLMTTQDFALSVGHQNNLRFSAGVVLRLSKK